MNAVSKAKRALEIALLEAMLDDPKPVTVCLCSGEGSLDLNFTVDDVRAAAQRQLAAMRPKCDGFKTTVAGQALRCHLDEGHDGQCVDDAGVQRWWRT
jgi:hypothetical protein